MSRRRALTLMEFLVSISIIGILMAMLLPAVQRSRGAARRAQCENNLKQLDLAMLGSAGTVGRFPASGWFRPEKNGTRFLKRRSPTTGTAPSRLKATPPFMGF